MKKIKPSDLEKQWGEDLERRGVLKKDLEDIKKMPHSKDQAIHTVEQEVPEAIRNVKRQNDILYGRTERWLMLLASGEKSVGETMDYITSQFDSLTKSNIQTALSARNREIREWIAENEYCSKCGSIAKYCPEWGRFASAIDTKDLIKFLQ